MTRVEACDAAEEPAFDPRIDAAATGLAEPRGAGDAALLARDRRSVYTYLNTIRNRAWSSNLTRARSATG